MTACSWLLVVLVFTTTTKTISSALHPTMSSDPVKAILFDLDGTLLDTEALSDRAVSLAYGAALPERARREDPALRVGRIPWELKRQLLGLRGAEWAPIAVDYGVEHWGVSREDPNLPSIPEFIKSWEDHLSELCRDVQECPGASALLRELGTIPMALATSSRASGVAKKRINHEETIFRHLRHVVCGDDPAVVRGKPAPDGYLEAARRLGVDPKDCLVFEDALSGVRAGKAAGCRVVAIPDNRFDEKEMEVFHKEADMVIPDLWHFDGTPFGLDVDMRKIKP